MFTVQANEIFKKSGHLLKEDNTVHGHLELWVNCIVRGHGKGNVINGFGCFFKCLCIGRATILETHDSAFNKDNLTHHNVEVAFKARQMSQKGGLKCKYTLKNPMTATSWSAIRDSASVTSVRVATAGPVRFFSQLTMSSACLPAARQ